MKKEDLLSQLETIDYDANNVEYYTFEDTGLSLVSVISPTFFIEGNAYVMIVQSTKSVLAVLDGRNIETPGDMNESSLMHTLEPSVEPTILVFSQEKDTPIGHSLAIVEDQGKKILCMFLLQGKVLEQCFIYKNLLNTN